MKISIPEIQEIIALAKKSASQTRRESVSDIADFIEEIVEGSDDSRALYRALIDLGLDKLKELQALTWAGRDGKSIEDLKSDLKSSRERRQDVNEIAGYLSAKSPLGEYLENSLIFLNEMNEIEGRL